MCVCAVWPGTWPGGAELDAIPRFFPGEQQFTGHVNELILHIPTLRLLLRMRRSVSPSLTPAIILFIIISVVVRYFIPVECHRKASSADFCRFCCLFTAAIRHQ